jgi:tetratricopeptide (TPR) repeat protein
MRLLLAVALMSALGTSCAQRNRSAALRPAAPQAGVTTMERQVINAVEAGEGDYEVRRLRATMAVEPGNLQVRLDLAWRYQERGYGELALEHYRLAATRFPDSAEVQLRLAKTLRQFGMQGEAAESLESFLGKNPQSSPELAAWLGILRDELGEWRKGESAHRAALALDSSRDYLRNNLGYNLLMQGRKDEAAEQFRLALQLRPDSAVARNNLGMAVASRPEEAVLHWQSVTDPATAHSNMAALLIEQGRYEEARRELDLALGYNRYHPAALKNLRLVSQLDGKPATIPIRPVESWWERWKSAARRAFIGEKREQRQGTAVNTASR